LESIGMREKGNENIRGIIMGEKVPDGKVEGEHSEEKRFLGG